MLRLSWRRLPLFLAVATLSLLAAPRFAAADDEEPIYLSPDNPDVVALIKVGEILKSPAFKKAQAAFPELTAKLDEPMGKKTKLTPRDLDTVYVFADTGKKDFVVVISLKKVVDEDEFMLDENAKMETIGDYELYIPDEDRAMSLVDDKVIAMGPAKTMRAVLKRDDDAEISDELETAWEDVDDEQHVYAVATLGNLMKLAGAALPPGFPISPDALQKLESATVTADAGEQVKINTEVNCGEAALAQQLKALIDVVIQSQAQSAPPGVKEALGSVKSGVDEEYLTVSADVGVDLILNLVKAQMGAPAAAPAPVPAPKP